MWRPRDRERFVGGYDPEHEMPDPERDRGDRYQSDAYRHNSRDTRFAYRMDPDRVEHRYDGPRDPRPFDRPGWEHDARDRERDARGGGSWDDRDRGRTFDRGMYGGPSSQSGHYSNYGNDYGRDRGRDSGQDYRHDHGRDYGRNYGGGGYGGNDYRNSGSYGSNSGSGGYGSGSGGYGGNFGNYDRGGYERDRWSADRGWDRGQESSGASWGGYGRDNRDNRDDTRDDERDRWDRDRGGSWGGYGRR
jgi:hypothetical protein